MAVVAGLATRPAASTVACALTPIRHLGLAHHRVGCNAWPDTAVSTAFICGLGGAHLFAATISKLPPLARFTPCPSLPASSCLAISYITHVASSKASHSSSSSDTSPRAAAHHERASTAIKSPFCPPQQSVPHCSPLSGTSLETAPFGSCCHFGCSPYHQHCQDNLYSLRSSILGGIEYFQPFLSHAATSVGLSMVSSLPYSSK